MDTAANSASQDNRIQISRIRRTSSFVMKRPHYHSYYEIYYLLSGQCRMFINQDIYYLKPGDSILIPPLTIHRALYEEGQQAERFDLYFSRESLGAFSASCGKAQSERVFSRPRVTFPPSLRPKVENLFGQIQEENRLGDAYSPVQMVSLLYQLLAMIGRCQDMEQKQDSHNSSEEAILQAARYINKQYHEPLTLDTMAAMANMSPTYFSKKFKSSTGFGFKEYLNYIRVQKASDLLRNSSQSVTAVAMACGFSDGNYFGDVFKKLTGLSPRQYRGEIQM